MKLYTESGWVNWDYILSLPSAFIMVVGARGTGKTYGIFKKLINEKKPFIYVRRLQSQLDISKSESGNPFRKLNADMGFEIMPRPRSKMCEFRHESGQGEIVSLGVALSTVATIRGFDFSGYDYIIYDECIPMIGEKPIKDEFNAFLNLYETVNRNRELEGQAPVKCIMLGNANQLANPYFSGWHFTKIALKMIRGGQMVYTTNDKTRTIILLTNSPISSAKRQTSLYQNANDGFLTMALDNAFRTDETIIASKPLQEYNHVVSVGEIGIYRHKSNREYYVSSVTQKQPYYEDYGMGLKMFQSDFILLRSLYMSGKRFVFESYENEILFRNYIKIS